MDCHFLLQGTFPTQGLNPGVPHCRQILYCRSHQRNILRFTWHDQFIKALASPQVSKCVVGTCSPKPANFLSCLTPSYTINSQQSSILHPKYFKILSLSLHPTSWSRLHHLHPLKASRLLFITPLSSCLSSYFSENTIHHFCTHSMSSSCLYFSKAQPQCVVRQGLCRRLYQLHSGHSPTPPSHWSLCLLSSKCTWLCLQNTHLPFKNLV